MKRYRHSLSNWKLLTGDMGLLYPVGLVEALPGDTFQHRTNAVIRLSPMAAPVMHPVTIRIHHFFVPHRLTWDGWETFITGGADGNDSSVIPTINMPGVDKDLFDYFGLPNVGGLAVSALPIRAYNLIHNEFYRDQDLVPVRAPDKTEVGRVAWEKDYFTTARPWPQKGPDITLPLGTTAPVVSKGSGIPTFKVGGGSTHDIVGNTGNTNLNWNSVPSAAGSAEWGATNLEADLSQASAVNVNEVRRAFALQRFQEARARYGSRYTEYLRFLGVSPRDSRLDRPEYLGGGKVRVSISEVVQTANEPTIARFGVGDLYGHGVGAVRSNAYRRFIPEHGYVVSLLSVRPRAMYTNGIHRTWLRQTKEDFFQKELQYIGQQEILKNEVYAETGAAGRETWGYGDRYAEYRSVPSNACGEFRDKLNYWHLARMFSGSPALNETFVRCEPSKRIFNVQTEDSLWMAVQHRCVARRLVDRSAYGKII